MAAKPPKADELPDISAFETLPDISAFEPVPQDGVSVSGQGNWQDQPPTPPAPAELTNWQSAKQDIKNVAGGMASLAGEVFSDQNKPDSLSSRMGLGIRKSVQEGTVGKDLYNAAEAVVSPVVEDVGAVIAPVIEHGWAKGLPKSFENIIRRPATYAMDALMIPGSGAVLAKALGVAAKGVSGTGKIADVAAAKAAERVIGSLIKPKDVSYMFGKNPERAIIKEGIVSPSMERLAKDVTAKKAEVGAMYDPIFNSAENAAKRIDLTPFDTVGFLKQAREKLKRHPETNAPYINKLDMTIRDLVGVRNAQGEVVGVRNFKGMTPQEVNNFKREIYDMTSYASEDTSQARKALSITNNALRQTANRVDRVLRVHVPEVHTLNQRYADLVGAEKAVNHRVKTLKKTNLQHLSDFGVGGMAGAAGHAAGASTPEMIAAGLAGAAASKIASSTPFKTGLAQVVSKGGELAAGTANLAAEGIAGAAPAISAAAPVAQAGRAYQSIQESLDADKAAAEWLQKNPDHPAAEKIKAVLQRKHGVKF